MKGGKTMALKNLRYTVNADGISPDYERRAGTQYDHKKTALQFTIDSEFYDEILSAVGDAKAVYRFDCYDGEGKLHTGVLNELLGISLEPYELEYWVTKFGGKLKVCLVITLTNEEVTVREWSYEAALVLDDLPESDIDSSKYQSMATLAKMADEACKEVEKKYQRILELYQGIAQLEDMFKNGEFVFDGVSGSDIDVKFVIDSELDINSEHALANKVITECFGKLTTQLDTLNKNIAGEITKSVTEEIKNEFYDKVYPIGSYYWSSAATSPEELFGGEWEQVKDVFVLAAGNNYSCGSTGGESEHMLSEKEMPKHLHLFDPNVGEGDGIDFVVPTGKGGEGVSSIKEWGTGEGPGHWASRTWGTGSKGGSAAHNNMPPYVAAYCWKRIG